MLRRVLLLLPLLMVLPFVPRPGAAAMAPGCADQPCNTCHTLDKAEAERLLGNMVDRVLAVREGKIPGFFELDLEKGGRKLPVYLHYSKRYMVTGDVIDLQARKDLTRERFIELNRVDTASIPLDDAVVIGDPAAPVRVVVFDDPECTFCKALHPEIQRAVKLRPDVAFFIKMLPLAIHPHARKKAEAIVCAKSAQMLEDSLAGKELPEPSCKTDQIDKNEAEAARLGVRSTPTLILPDGRVMPGKKTAEQILALLGPPAPKPAKP